MNRAAKIIVGIVVAAVVVGAGVTWFAFQPRDSVSDSVLTETIERRDVTTTVAASGVVEPVAQLSVSFRQPGQLATIDVEEGDVVAEGDVLATLETADFEAAVAAARSGVETARAQIAGAEQAQAAATQAQRLADQQIAAADLAIAVADDALVNVDEQKTVAQRQRATALAQREAANAQAEAATAQKSQANAALASAQAQLAQAQRALDDTVLTAPIAGTVVSIASQVGEPLAPAGGVGGGFIVLADFSAFSVTADFAEADVVGIEPGQDVSVTFDAIPGAGLTAQVSNVAFVGRVDPSGGRLTTYPVTITLPSAPSGLRAGMTAQASITTESRSDVLAAPVTALIERGEDTFVQVLQADGTLLAVEVTVGIQGGYWIEITSGLSGGERVVTGASGDIPVVGGGGFGGPPEGTRGGPE